MKAAGGVQAHDHRKGMGYLKGRGQVMLGDHCCSEAGVSGSLYWGSSCGSKETWTDLKLIQKLKSIEFMDRFHVGVKEKGIYEF